MAYTKVTNFAVKDGLPSGNPSKIVKGTEIDVEFNAIQAESVSVTSALSGKQPLDATLTSIAALGTAADKLAYTTNTDTWAETPITAAARTVLDDASVATMRVTLGTETSVTGSAILPAGTTAQRDITPVSGYLRYNSTLNQFEGYGASAWGAVGGGATGAPGNYAFYENDQTITADYTLTSGKQAGTFGPITIDTGVTVTVPTGATWSIV